VIKGLFFY